MGEIQSTPAQEHTPDPESVQLLDTEDAFVDPDYRKVHVVYRHRFLDGRREYRKVMVMARDLGWREDQRLTEKHTKIRIMGRQQFSDFNQTAYVEEALNLCVKWDQCEPRLDKDRVGTLNRELWTAMVKALNLVSTPLDGDEAGESNGPPKSRPKLESNQKTDV